MLLQRELTENFWVEVSTTAPKCKHFRSCVLCFRQNTFRMSCSGLVLILQTDTTRRIEYQKTTDWKLTNLGLFSLEPHRDRGIWLRRYRSGWNSFRAHFPRVPWLMSWREWEETDKAWLLADNRLRFFSNRVAHAIKTLRILLDRKWNDVSQFACTHEMHMELSILQTRLGHPWSSCSVALCRSWVSFSTTSFQGYYKED